MEVSLRDGLNYPIVGAHISLQSGQEVSHAFSDVNGYFSLTLPAERHYILLATHLMYQPAQRQFFLKASESLSLRLVMNESVLLLNQISVSPKEEDRQEAGLVDLTLKELHRLPAATQDVSQLIALLPGVVSGPGLSNAYSVRGGSYEENLVYVEGIPIYKAYINNASEQEGLGLVNPALVGKMLFSSGAWGADRGDKLSSVLDVSYASPERNRGGLQLGLLGGGLHYQWGTPTSTFTHLVATRYKDTRALLFNDGVRGQYQPIFFDAQYLMRLHPHGVSDTGGAPQTLTFLASYARNRYQLFPRAQRVKFGTLDRQLLFNVGLAGKVLLHHDVYQLGVNFSHDFSPHVQLETIHSYASSLERQFTDLETHYRLCDVLPTEEEGTAELCETEIAVGRGINYARNFLLGHATFHEVNMRFPFAGGGRGFMKVGANFSYDGVADIIGEYQYENSADHLQVSHAISQENRVYRLLYGGYLQYESPVGAFSDRRVKGGVRWGYNHLSKEFWLSPRFQFAFKTSPDAPTRYTLGTGIYYQPSFYREARRVSGDLNTGLKAQRSFHFLAGAIRRFRMWARDFGFSSELYYKYLDRLVPYDQRDVFLQYYAQNMSTGYAYGIDFRLHGFFLPYEESWFSLGLLSTAEDIRGDGLPRVRRPTDQRVTVGIFFRDHVPRFPSWKVSIRGLYGSGLPFNPPGEPVYRNQFVSSAYYRLDIGFSKSLFSKKGEGTKRSFSYFRDVIFTLEAINLLGSGQVISYSWIKTPDKQRFAVPNVYATRFFNAKMEVLF